MRRLYTGLMHMIHSHNKHLALLAIAMLLLAFNASASLYCGAALIKVGDPQYRVAEACPRPFYEEQLPVFAGHGYAATVGALGFEQVWYFNFGSSKLMRRMVFSHGRLQRIDELGYGVGYVPGSRRCSARDLANAGTLSAEIYARCGAPDYVYDAGSDYARSFRYGHLPAVTFTRWIYSWNGNSLDRELLFRNGRLMELRAVSR